MKKTLILIALVITIAQSDQVCETTCTILTDSGQCEQWSTVCWQE